MKTKRQYRAGQVVTLPLPALTLDAGTQMRDRLDLEAVRDYAQALRDGAELPPIDAVSDGVSHWPTDGFHRVEAHGDAGLAKIQVRITPGTLDDAVLAAAAANREHGVRRNNDTKKRAVTAVLGRHPEWTDGRIAEHCGVSQPFARKIRGQVITVITSDEVITVITSDEDGPPTRTGRDGKQYPARRVVEEPTDDPPAPEPEPQTNGYHGDEYADPPFDDDPFGIYEEPPAEEAAPEPEPEPPQREPGDDTDEIAAPPLDAVGMPIPEGLRVAFAASAAIDAVAKALRAASRSIGDLAKRPGGEALRRRCELRESEGRQSYRLDRVHAAVHDVLSCRPHASACPHCHQRHPGRAAKDCRCCLGAGWATKDAWEACPADYRAAVEQARKAGEP